MTMLLSLSLLVIPSVARADDEVEEIVVWGDLFARWDDTRWFVSAELGLPIPLLFARDENIAFETRELAMAMVYACSKEWKLTKRRFEVTCTVEDFGVRAAVDEWEVTERDVERAQRVLDEIDAKLTGAALSLQVADDGRVTNIGLDGVPKDNRRESAIHESLRLLLTRAFVGFHLKMQKYNQLDQRQWLEHNSTIMNLPGSLGSNRIVHSLDRYGGHVVVQSVGFGMTTVGLANFVTDFVGVSIFDDVEGFMVERVWTLQGKSTASGFFDQGTYFQAGRITMLGDADDPDCGTTQVVSGRNQYEPFLPAWIPQS